MFKSLLCNLYDIMAFMGEFVIYLLLAGPGSTPWCI